MNINAQQIKSDTVTLLLCSRINAGLDTKQRALKIARCCKVIRDRTKDEPLYNACRIIIKAVSNGRYNDVIKTVELAEANYFLEFSTGTNHG